MNDHDRENPRYPDYLDPFAEHDPFEAEAAFDEAIAAAFARMGPSEETEDRMLAALLATCDEGSEHTEKRAQVANDNTPRKSVLTIDPKGRRRKRRIGKALLPAAACLVLLVGVGAFAYYGSLSNSLSSTDSSMHDLSSAGTTSSAESTKDPSTNSEPSDEAPQVIQDVLSENAGSSASGDAGSNASSDASAGADANADADARYPFVRLASGRTLRIAIDDAGIPLIANPSLVGTELEQATASNGTPGDTVTCTVFASTSTEHPYAVRYAGEERAFWADETE